MKRLLLATFLCPLSGAASGVAGSEAWIGLAKTEASSSSSMTAATEANLKKHALAPDADDVKKHLAETWAKAGKRLDQLKL